MKKGEKKKNGRLTATFTETQLNFIRNIIEASNLPECQFCQLAIMGFCKRLLDAKSSAWVIRDYCTSEILKIEDWEKEFIISEFYHNLLSELKENGKVKGGENG